jgi:hypothetical protein
LKKQEDKRKDRSAWELSIAPYYRKSKITNIDVFSIVSDESAAYVNFYKFHMVRLFAISYHGNQEETGGDAELLELA